MQSVGLGTVIVFAVFVLDVDKVVLADAKPFDPDVGIRVSETTRIDRIFTLFRVISGLSLDGVWQSRGCPVGVLKERRKAGIVLSCEPVSGVCDAELKRFFCFIV